MYDLPIFILGCGRSGTSLLRRILDSHSRIACPPESAFLVKLADMMEVGRIRECFHHMGYSDDDVLGEMRRFFTHFLCGYAESKGKFRWADKTSRYMDHLCTIDRIFCGEVQYIGIVRHGLDVSYSLQRHEWGSMAEFTDGVEKPVGAARFWEYRNRQLLRHQEEVGGRLHIISYEDLTTIPEATMMGVMDHLGEEWEPNILEYTNFPHDSGYEDRDIDGYDGISPNSGNYRRWPLELQHRVYDEVREMMEELGYGSV